MADLYDLLRSSNSPDTRPAGAAVSATSSGQTVVPGQPGERVVVIGGMVSSASDTLITISSGSTALVSAFPLAANTPLPLSPFGLFTEPGEALRITADTADTIVGRVVYRRA